jgi:hypothetical protein
VTPEINRSCFWRPIEPDRAVHDHAQVMLRSSGQAPAPEALAVLPTVIYGAKGMKFVDAAVESSKAGGVWMKAGL